MKIRAIISDLDGVIRRFPSERVRLIESSASLPAGTITRIAFAEALLSQVICGRISDSSWRRQIEVQLSREFPHCDASTVIREWSSSPGEVSFEVYELLLSCRLPVSLLTNATDRLNLDLEKLGLSRTFTRIFNSSEIGFAKPDSRIFDFVRNQLSLWPEEILFIDDNGPNCEAAASLGFSTIHFLNVSQLRRELLSGGIVI